MAKRHGFTMPFPVHVALQHQQDRPFTAPDGEGADLLAQFPRLPEIPPEDRARIRALTFGAGERLFDEGDDLGGVYFVVSGAVSLQMVTGWSRERDRDDSGRGVLRRDGHARPPGRDMRAVALEDTAWSSLRRTSSGTCSRRARGWRAKRGIPSRSTAKRSTPRARCAAHFDPDR